MMPFASDQSAPDSECWFRVITNENHITKDETVHYQALKNRAFSKSSGKAWQHELSGRAVSLAGMATEIVADAELRIERIREGFATRGQHMPSSIKFAGVACAEVNEIRGPGDCQILRDVLYDGFPDDDAHSNIVTYETETDEDIDPLRNWLMSILRIVRPADMDDLVNSCGGFAPTTAS